MKPGRLNGKEQDWVDARKRHNLSHAQVQMARELGMNPRKLGKLDNHHQAPWKLPLPRIIEELYFKRFRKDRPDVVESIETRARREAKQKAIRREARLLRKQSATPEGTAEAPERVSGVDQPTS